MIVVKDERRAREVSMFRETKHKDTVHAKHKSVNLEDMFGDVDAQEKKQLNILLKADVQGSVEALSESLLSLHVKEYQHAGTS